MFIITWFLKSSFLRCSFPFQFGRHDFQAGILHRANALLLQIFLDFIVVDSVNSDRSPKLLKFLIDGHMGCLIVIKQYFLLINGPGDVDDIFVEYLKRASVLIVCFFHKHYKIEVEVTQHTFKIFSWLGKDS